MSWSHLFRSRFLLTDLHRSKERQRQDAVDLQHEGLQLLIPGPSATLPHDLHRITTHNHSPKQLHGQPRPSEHLSPHPYSPRSSSIPPLRLPGDARSVDGAPIWNFYGPVVIHPPYETSDSVPLSPRHCFRGLHRRLYPGLWPLSNVGDGPDSVSPVDQCPF